MKTFQHQTPEPDDIIVPVTTVYRVKLFSDGTIDNLKTRICLRGDKQSELVNWETWCSIAGFKELKQFLALAAKFICRIYQLDYVGAFLEALAKNGVFTTLPKEWEKYFPDLKEWFGVPLRLLKSLYGSIDASENWDDILSE